ncbi:hypothetical protein, partial [Bowmanella yangjiangensis]
SSNFLFFRCLPFPESFCLPGLPGYPVEVVRILEISAKPSTGFLRFIKFCSSTDYFPANWLVFVSFCLFLVTLELLFRTRVQVETQSF